MNLFARSSSTCIDSKTRFSVSLLKEAFRTVNEMEEAKIGTIPAVYFSAFGNFYLCQLVYKPRGEGEGRPACKPVGLHVICQDKITGEQQFTQDIGFVEKRSNLDKGYYYYFRSPNNGKTLYRNLYFSQKGELWGLDALGHYHYKSQYEKIYNGFFSAIRFCWGGLKSLESPRRKYGKVEYRGKLTPYGKRLYKFQERWDKMWEKVASATL